MKKIKILFTGGGTAGHIFPIIGIVREFRKLGVPAEFFYLGPADSFSHLFLSQEGIRVKTVMAGKIRRYGGFQSILLTVIDVLFKIPLGLIQSFFLVFFLFPNLIFSKGGYGSIGTVFSGWLLQIPLFIHESDVSPGLANRLAAKLVRQVFVSFPVAQTEYFSGQKMTAVGNPIRKELLGGSREEAKRLFDLTGEKPLVLVLGGSQGAQKINDTVLAVLPQLLGDFELIHQTGEKNFDQVSAEAKVVVSKELEKYYHPLPFLKEIELKHAYGVSDIIVGRAGSGTIFEIAAVGKPSILIPLSSAAQNHQIKNAYAYLQSGACVVLEETNLTPYFFLEKLKYLATHSEEAAKMKAGAMNFARPDASRTLAQYIFDYLKK